VHATRGAPSRLHWNVEFASLEVNAKEALVDVDVAGGPDVIVVSGAVVSPPPPPPPPLIVSTSLGAAVLPVSLELRSSPSLLLESIARESCWPSSPVRPLTVSGTL
jgi:hypothetical protein